MTEHHHFVQHFLRSGDYVSTEFSCTAPEGASCRMACQTCMNEQRERCECGFSTFNVECEDRLPDMRDQGCCIQLPWLTEDAPEECYDGARQPVRGPDPQPINLKWTGDYYTWDYA